MFFTAMSVPPENNPPNIPKGKILPAAAIAVIYF